MANTNKNDDGREIREIYLLLKEGKGQGRVTRDNIEALKVEALADNNNEQVLRELRDWR